MTISGSGFDSGSRVEWRRGGVVDPRIAVKKVEYVNSSTLVATIDIALDAEVTLYDVAVITASGKQGIGTELFEVTTAIIASGNVARGVNDDGVVVGRGDGFALFPDGALVPLADGAGWSIDAASATVVGLRTVPTSAGGSEYFGVFWRLNGRTADGGTVLPVTSTSESSRSFRISPSGEYIAGVEVPAKTKVRNKYVVTAGTVPLLWRRDGASWIRIPLPRPDTAFHSNARNIDDSGWAVGSTSYLPTTVNDGRAVIWERLDETTWLPRVVGPTASHVAQMNSTHTLAVGRSADVAVYWTRSQNGNWVGPTRLAGQCTHAVGVSDTDVIVAGGCTDGKRTTSAVFFGVSALPLYLSGLGDRSVSGDATAISRNGRFISGSASSSEPGSIGVYWRF